MELQGLQEALKVELQCHRNQTLCKGLNELQNGQKLAVRSCPVGTARPLSLIKPPGQGIAISVVPAKTPVSMVTAHINGQKPAGPEPLQTTAAGLQGAGRPAPAGAAVVPFIGGRRAGDLLPPTQMLGTLTAVPIKVPQVSSLHRLAGQAATVLPQVRPKTQIPDSLPHSPCQEPPLSLQRVAAMVSPFSSDRQPPAAPLLAPSAGPGVAYAIIAASPASGNGVSAVSEAVKVIIIQPQSTEGPPGALADLPSPEPPKNNDPEKMAFMVALGLITTEQLEEIQTKRQERKRRSTANPAYSGLLEPLLCSALMLTSEDFCWKEELEHEDRCAVCKEDGELQLCHNCPRAFHPGCLHPPIRSPHRSAWYFCFQVLNKENESWPQSFVQSYVTHKMVRQEEKRRLLEWNDELKKECEHLCVDAPTPASPYEAPSKSIKHKVKHLKSALLRRKRASRVSAGLRGSEGPTPQAAERRGGVARPPQDAHQAHPARPARPGHHDDCRHAPPAVESSVGVFQSRRSFSSSCEQSSCHATSGRRERRRALERNRLASLV